MKELVRVNRVRFTPVPLAHRRSDLIGFASASLSDIGRLDGLAVYQTGSGSYSVTFPGRRDQSGQRHPWFRPRDEATRRAIERGVIEALRARGVLP